MAAALRQAAWRFAGVHRTTHAAAIAEERRRLLPRLIHTDQNARPRRAPTLEDVMDLIQERKEELYDLVEATPDTKSMFDNYQNRKLLKFLCKQVKPRPHDPQWCRVWKSQRTKDVAKLTILISGCILCYLVLLLIAERENEESQTTEKKEAQTAKEEEAQTAQKEDIVIVFVERQR